VISTQARQISDNTKLHLISLFYQNITHNSRKVYIQNQEYLQTAQMGVDPRQKQNGYKPVSVSIPPVTALWFPFKFQPRVSYAGMV
jgi:hypothetical protein